MSLDNFDHLGELTNRQPDGDRDKGEVEEEEVIKEMSMKTQALSQEVVVAKRREAIGKKGEEEAEAKGTSSTLVGGQYDDLVVLCCLMVDRSYIVDREPARRMEATSKRECANLFSSSTFSPFSRLSSFPPPDLPIGQKLPRP